MGENDARLRRKKKNYDGGYARWECGVVFLYSFGQQR
jgi:hypothetical protein